MLTLELHTPTKVPLEVETILPEHVRELPAAEVARLKVQNGNRQVELGAFFHVRGSAVDDAVEWMGDLKAVHRIGQQMTRGRIFILGNVGRHVGSEMRGGEILVEGNASDWVGGEMKKGLIRVKGSAGNLVGGAYRGGLRGMTGGTILIDGDAGDEVAHSQRRGLIAIGGNVGSYAAINMLAGTLIVKGSCGLRPGAGMRRGSLVFLGPRPELLPTFRFGCRYAPTWLPMVARQLKEQGFELPVERLSDPVDLFHGDLLHGGRGEVILL
jgi:formylmethanofuran dehydrogenase subunit C